MNRAGWLIGGSPCDYSKVGKHYSNRAVQLLQHYRQHFPGQTHLNSNPPKRGKNRLLLAGAAPKSAGKCLQKPTRRSFRSLFLMSYELSWSLTCSSEPKQGFLALNEFRCVCPAASSESTFGTWPTESWFSCFPVYTDGAHQGNYKYPHGRAGAAVTGTILQTYGRERGAPPHR